MRRAVFGYWLMPEEEAEFLDFLDTTGTVVAYPNHWVRTKVEAAPSPLRSYLAEHNPNLLKLGLGQHSGEELIKSMDQEQFFGFDLMDACLIAYTRPRFRIGNQLGKSNLAAYLDVSTDNALHPKPKWFQLWVKQVFTWAKKHAQKKCVHQHFSYPATQLVLKLAEEGKIEPTH